MSVIAQAKAARRKARQDWRYANSKNKDPLAIARRQAALVYKQNAMKNRKSKKK
jgi:hypothetical protein